MQDRTEEIEEKIKGLSVGLEQVAIGVILSLLQHATKGLRICYNNDSRNNNIKEK